MWDKSPFLVVQCLDITGNRSPQNELLELISFAPKSMKKKCQQQQENDWFFPNNYRLKINDVPPFVQPIEHELQEIKLIKLT